MLSNWLPLRCFVPVFCVVVHIWVYVYKRGLVCEFDIVDIYWFAAVVHVCIHQPNFVDCTSSQMILLWNRFCILSTLFSIKIFINVFIKQDRIGQCIFNGLHCECLPSIALWIDWIHRGCRCFLLSTCLAWSTRYPNHCICIDLFTVIWLHSNSKSVTWILQDQNEHASRCSRCIWH